MFNRKRAALLICVAFLFGAFFAVQGQVIAGESGTGPGTKGDPLVSRSYVEEQVNKLQQQVTKLQQEVGYLKGELAQIREQYAPGENLDTDVSVKGKQGIVSSEKGAIVRSGPGKNFAQVGGLKKAAKVEILEHQGGWYRITTKTGLSGWVSGKLLVVNNHEID